MRRSTCDVRALLVPKLRLGTDCLEALLRLQTDGKQSFQRVRSQAELGNEKKPGFDEKAGLLKLS